MPTRILAKPVRIQLVIFKKHVADALEQGKEESGIRYSTTYLEHLIVTAVKNKS